MAKTDYKTINEYHDAFPKDAQQRMQQIRQIIKKVAPEAEEVISYQIPAFKIGKKFLIYYSAYAKHISLSSPWSEAFLNNFEKDLKDFKVSRSAIQLPNDKPLPLDLIKRFIEFRKKETV
ncbi:MAG: iron chaperone [Agriterribacter sp.]